MTDRTTFEVSGRVKWFNSMKGFGFLVCDGVDGDVLVHHSVLRELGRREVPEGAELVVAAYKGERGYHVEKVISIDMRGALPPRPASKSVKSTREPHGEAGPFETVTVKWFDPVKGYGFLLRGDDNAFVHAATFRSAGLPFPDNGVEIEARLAHSTKGLIAAEVRGAQQPQAIAA